ncbi:ribokinase [Anopheles sinensis]|uniref:Ribokinase n=1 Tax=Anopheles sinensis TaxID=74873 RepID=A0A084W2T3_ANOSI|nr:ribokinase [Anopheles sinensis]
MDSPHEVNCTRSSFVCIITITHRREIEPRVILSPCPTRQHPPEQLAHSDAVFPPTTAEQRKTASHPRHTYEFCFTLTNPNSEALLLHRVMRVTGQCLPMRSRKQPAAPAGSPPPPPTRQQKVAVDQIDRRITCPRNKNHLGGWESKEWDVERAVGPSQAWIMAHGVGVRNSLLIR